MFGDPAEFIDGFSVCCRRRYGVVCQAEGALTMAMVLDNLGAEGAFISMPWPPGDDMRSRAGMSGVAASAHL